MRPFSILAAIALAMTAVPVAAAPPPIEMAEFMVPTGDPGISLYLRNKHPQRMAAFRPDNVVLFVHGSTYPAETAFDLPLGGMSWMDYIAQHGYDVWLVDVRGYGKSSRPPEMDQPAIANPPIVRTATAVKDVGTAVDYIKTKRAVRKIDLMGWSWGTTIMGMYTADHNENVNKLVLYAPQWLRAAGNVALTAQSGPLGAYRSVSMASAKTRWLNGVMPEKVGDLIPAGWFEQWAAATIASDPVGSKMSPPVLRAPNGTVADTAEYWAVGKPLYDPSRITVPTLLVHAEWDQDLPTYMDEAYYKLLTNVPYKRYVQIGEGTHTIVMEKNRMQLFAEVQLFLDEQRTAP